MPITQGAPPHTGLDDEPVMRRPAHSVGFATRTTPTQLHGGAAVLWGWSLLETTGAAPATVELFDGYDAGAQLLAVVALSAGQSDRDWFGGPGIDVREGLFLNVVNGSVRGAVWLGLVMPAGARL